MSSSQPHTQKAQAVYVVVACVVFCNGTVLPQKYLGFVLDAHLVARTIRGLLFFSRKMQRYLLLIFFCPRLFFVPVFFFRGGDVMRVSQVQRLYDLRLVGLSLLVQRKR
jgi:hypothetical protein